MAPGARIWPVKVLTDAGTGLNSDVICGIDYVTAHADEIEVANMSLGGGGEDDGSCGARNDDAMHAAICESVAAGVTYVVAAGNDSADASTSTPAAYDEVITVSALADFDGLPGGGAPSTCRNDQDDTFASFSNYGSDVDLIAPGVCIESTSMLGGYDTLSGTSMASPHVAGAAALYAANNPGASPAQVKSALQNAGSTDWSDADDPDSTQERLLDAGTFSPPAPEAPSARARHRPVAGPRPSSAPRSPLTGHLDGYHSLPPPAPRPRKAALKGIIFNLVEETVSTEYGDDTWDSLLEAADVEGSYTSLGNYDDAEIHRLVDAGSEALDVPAKDLTEWLGRDALLRLSARYPHFFAPHASTRPFLLTLNDVIHPEVRKVHRTPSRRTSTSRAPTRACS